MIAEWAVAVTVLRGELDVDIKSFAVESAHAFRRRGLSALEVGVWLVAVDAELLMRKGAESAHTYWNDIDLTRTGQIAIYWLGPLAIVVTVGDHIEVCTPGLNLAGKAVVKAWPDPVGMAWPPASSILDSTLLRLTGLPEDSLPAAFSARERPPGGRENIGIYIRDVGPDFGENSHSMQLESGLRLSSRRPSDAATPTDGYRPRS